MTFWKTNKKSTADARLVKETVETIQTLQLADTVYDSPEWACVAEAAESLDLPVLAIALEVVASHHAEELRSNDIELIEAVADSIRCGRVAEVKALVNLMERSALALRQAA